MCNLLATGGRTRTWEFGGVGKFVMAREEMSATELDRKDGNHPANLNLVEAWVDEHADYLLRYALPRLRDRHVAEEVLQETFMAALKSAAKFRGDSSARTWLVGLLRRKIADHYRKRGREPQTESLDTTDSVIDGWFDEKGMWKRWPGEYDVDPSTLQDKADFWRVFETCLKALPERLAEAFALRVVDDREPDDVCKVLSITSTNLWVSLHRARARLRVCLEANWFQSEIEESG